MKIVELCSVLHAECVGFGLDIVAFVCFVLVETVITGWHWQNWVDNLWWYNFVIFWHQKSESDGFFVTGSGPAVGRLWTVSRYLAAAETWEDVGAVRLLFTLCHHHHDPDNILFIKIAKPSGYNGPNSGSYGARGLAWLTFCLETWAFWTKEEDLQFCGLKIFGHRCHHLL